MMEKRTETAGKLAKKAFEKHKGEFDYRDIRKEAEKDYLKKLINTAAEGLKVYNHDFFVVTEAKVEPLIKNVIRNMIFHRATCPTPHYGQTVYMVRYDTEDLVFLWDVPDKAFAKDLYHNSHLYRDEFYSKIQMVSDFFDGTLARKALKLNGEDMEIAKHVVIK